VEELVRAHGLSVVVQPSPLRIFADEEYEAAGAELREDLTGCPLVLGVKEVPLEKVLPDTAYVCFSHVIKGQESNMPLLQQFLDRRSTLVDYEPIVDRYGRRLIFFGRHAGYAGMIDALWAFGQRLEREGLNTPFSQVEPAHRYGGVEDAADFLTSQVGRRLREQRLPEALHPLVVGFTGGGNVSQGAQAILDRLPVVEVDPDDLPGLASDSRLSRRAVYKTVFRRHHRSQDFARYLPHLTMLVNGIYWEPGQPRLVSRRDIRRLWERPESPPKLRIIADLSCDVEGSVEVTVRTTSADDPVFTYHPETGEAPAGVEGTGPVILAVDNLPAELPRNASEHFGDSLFPFVEALARADYGADFEYLSLPAALLGAVITHRGELTPTYRYLEGFLP
jgi:alpha-aminoadipic semialdehyde synthase